MGARTSRAATKLAKPLPAPPPPPGVPRDAEDFYPPRQILPGPSKAAPEVGGLWIGSDADSRNPPFWAAHDIQLVVNCSRDIPSKHANTYRVPVHDDPREQATMLAHIPIAVRLVHEQLMARRGVLVHCYAGMQRSATVVAAYLMFRAYERWRLGQLSTRAATAAMRPAAVMAAIKRRKPETFRPTPTFLPALKEYSTMLTLLMRQRKR